MLGTVLGRLVTLIRPDRAELIPTVDFDVEHGELDVLLEISLRGRSIPIRGGLVARGGGTIGARRFRFPPRQVATFKRALKYLEWRGPSRLRASGQSVPHCLEILRAGFPLQESERARAVTLRDASVAAYVDARDPHSLAIEVAGVADHDQTFPLSIKDLETGRVHREGTTFYKTKPLSEEIVELLRDGALEHRGDVGRVRQLANQVLNRLKKAMTVRLSGSAEMLLSSASRPVEGKLIPSVEFSPHDGKLGIRLDELSSTGQHPVQNLKTLDAVHLVDGQFIETDSAGRDLLRQLMPLIETIQGDVLQVVGGAVPEALRVLRLQPDLNESEAAKTVQIHDISLEQRTYLELEDADTLVVKQNLLANGERVVAPPEALPDDASAWLRVGTEFFRPPKKKANRLTRGRQVAPGVHELRGDDLPEFIEKDLPDLKQAGRVFMQPEVSAIRVVTAAPEVRTAIDFDEEKAQIKVRAGYRSGVADLQHDEVAKQDRRRRYMRAGSSFHRIDWEQVERVNRAVADAGLVREADGSYVAPALHFNEIVNTFSRLGLLSETEVFQRFRERLLDFSKIESAPLPSTLRTDVQVREYQRAGYDWLAFLKDHGLPGVLADEMGLGKTLQVLLAVAHFRDRYGPCPSLVVCPAALVEKWVDETGKFFRGLRGISHAGSRRAEQLRENIGGADVVVTSYETLVRDADLLARWRWRFVIADEAQRVKNPGTQRARAVRKIPAEARIAITGTPVENRLFDLWSIFDFLAAGYLGTATEFQRSFEEPIKRGNRQAVDTLTRKTRPFLLRRLKRHVAKELPEKLLKPLRCDLTPSQRELYSAVLARDFEAAITAAGGKKLSLGNPHILAVLTKLKQICCHPGLFTHDFQPYKSGVSGKFDMFMEVLEEIIDANPGEGPDHKLVGFSQYVLMAGYLADYIRSLRKSCAVIDGSVPPRDRPGLCKAFNSDNSQFGMMLTLSSGGVGLDLQSANYVVMYDRWWNPAVEDQAIDRVHRLGQERQVVVITLTTRGTLEERIEAKLEGKRSLSGMVIQADELMRKEITRDELLELVKLD